MPTLALERPGKAREVTRGRVPPSLAVRIAPVDVHEEASKRAHVLVVVAHDVDERPGLAPAEVIEVAAGDLPARDVGAPSKPEQLRLDRRQPRVGHTVAEDPANEGQQVQMARVQRRVGARHSVPRHKKRPVEAPTVVRHEPAADRDPRRELGEESRLVGVIGQQQLDLPEAAALPPAEADEEGECPRSRRQPRRFRVEAEQGSVRRWLARQRRQPAAIHGEERARRLDPDERPTRRPHQLAVDGRGKPLRPDGRGAADISQRRLVGRVRGSEVREPALKQR